MKKILSTLILLLMVSSAYSQTAIPLLGFSSSEVIEKLKDNSDFKLVSQGDFSKHGGDVYLCYLYTKIKLTTLSKSLYPVYTMYIFNDIYGVDNSTGKIDDNQCVDYKIIGANEFLTSFIADINNRCTKTNGNDWMTKDKKCKIILVKGGSVQLDKDVTIILLPTNEYSTLEFTPHDPDEVVFEDVLH